MNIAIFRDLEIYNFNVTRKVEHLFQFCLKKAKVHRRHSVSPKINQKGLLYVVIV